MKTSQKVISGWTKESFVGESNFRGSYIKDYIVCLTAM
jgi:hypothetical protein